MPSLLRSFIMRRATLPAWVFVILAASWALARQPSTDRDRLQGTWRAVRVQAPGEKAKDVKEAGLTITFRGEKYAEGVKGETAEEGTFTLRPEKSPRQIDIRIGTGKDKGKTQLGIYKLEGDTATFALAPPGSTERPTSFTPPAGGKTSVQVFRRAKKPEGPFTPSGPSRQVRVEVAGDVLMVNATRLRMPTSRKQLVKALGDPTREETPGARVLIWDEQGIVASQPSDRADVLALVIALNKRPYPWWPKSLFAGSFRVDGASVTVNSTAQQLNRSRKKKPLQQDATLKGTWAIRHERLYVLFLEADVPAGGAKGTFSHAEIGAPGRW
jgi:uncharacterized protein (TIGR03067 family)